MMDRICSEACLANCENSYILSAYQAYHSYIQYFCPVDCNFSFFAHQILMKQQVFCHFLIFYSISIVFITFILFSSNGFLTVLSDCRKSRKIYNIKTSITPLSDECHDYGGFRRIARRRMIYIKTFE